MTTIWLNVTHGFQARMLLRSQIAGELLAAGTKLIVCSPNAEEAYFQQEFDHPQIRLIKMPYRASKTEARLSLVRQYLLMNPALGATLNHKREALRRKHPLRYYASALLNPVFGRIGAMRKAYTAAERRLFPGREFDPLLKRHQPDLIVTGTPGYNESNVHLLRAALRHNISTCTVMLSWDNLTSKGYMNAVPDHLLVWSDLMAAEAQHYHDFPRERTDWVGAAQFDHYYGFRETFDRVAWRARHGISPTAPLLVYGTINPAILPHELEIVRQIAGAVAQQRFGKDAVLWVRLHPQAVRGTFCTTLAPYEALAGRHVRIEKPAVQSETLHWDLPRDDSIHLASLLCAADIVATPSSTLVIDAACLDTPVISVQFDGGKPVEAAFSAKRFLQYTHYAEILRTGGIAIAHTLDEFVQHVHQYQHNPKRDAAGRQAIIRQQLGRLDGQSGRRTAARLLELARGNRKSAPASCEPDDHPAYVSSV